MESLFLFTFLYILVCMGLIFRTQEFVSAGFTVEALWSYWLNEEENEFVYYHIKRTVAMRVTAASLPLVYTISLLFFKNLSINLIWQCAFSICLIIEATCFYFIYQWYKTNWRNHPIALQLKTQSSHDGRTLDDISKEINREFRSVDKLIIPCGTLSKVIVTENWIMLVSNFNLQIAQLDNSALIAVSNDTYTVSLDGRNPPEYLNIRVVNSTTADLEFMLRMSSVYFKELNDKVTHPIVILDNVKLLKSLMDRFVDTFQEQVALNSVISNEWGQETCMICLQKQADVKLAKQCQQPKCTNCQCRPLMCVECLAKWFASRQNSDYPETWLSSTCTCPLCRAVFCILDVVQLQS